MDWDWIGFELGMDWMDREVILSSIVGGSLDGCGRKGEGEGKWASE